jgi:hypothetical protein
MRCIRSSCSSPNCLILSLNLLCLSLICIFASTTHQSRGASHLQPRLVPSTWCFTSAYLHPRLIRARGASHLQPRLVPSTRCFTSAYLHPRLITARGASHLQPRLVPSTRCFISAYLHHRLIRVVVLHICSRGSSRARGAAHLLSAKVVFALAIALNKKGRMLFCVSLSWAS